MTPRTSLRFSTRFDMPSDRSRWSAAGYAPASRPTCCRRALEHLGVPVVHSLMGLDVLGHDHPLRIGMIGSYGNRWANHALGDCDVLLVLGSRLDIRQTGTDIEGFARRTIVHVDVDPGEIEQPGPRRSCRRSGRRRSMRGRARGAACRGREWARMDCCTSRRCAHAGPTPRS